MMIPTVLAAFAFVFIVFFCLVFFITRSVYNTYHNPRIENHKPNIVLEMTYDELCILVNLLWDIHQELSRPALFRFWWYPTKRMQPAHQFLLDKYTKKLAILEELAILEGSAKTENIED